MHSTSQRTIARVTNSLSIVAIVIMILSLCLFPNASAQKSHVAQENTQSSDEHVRQVLETLPQDNDLRFALEKGSRGSGVHYAWMDRMRQEGIKQASFKIRFVWCRKTKKLDITDTGYLPEYYRYNTTITDRSKLREIRESGLKRALAKAVLIRAHADLTQRAASRSNCLCGILYLNLLDDEILPILDEMPQVNNRSENGCKGQHTTTARHSHTL